MSNLTIRHLSN